MNTWIIQIQVFINVYVSSFSYFIRKLQSLKLQLQETCKHFLLISLLIIILFRLHFSYQLTNPEFRQKTLSNNNEDQVRPNNQNYVIPKPLGQNYGYRHISSKERFLLSLLLL